MAEFSRTSSYADFRNKVRHDAKESLHTELNKLVFTARPDNQQVVQSLNNNYNNNNSFYI